MGKYYTVNWDYWRSLQFNKDKKVIVFSYYTNAGRELPRIRVYRGCIEVGFENDPEPGMSWQVNEHGNNHSLSRPCLREKNYEKVFKDMIWFYDTEPYEVLVEKAKTEFKRRWAEKYNVHDYFTRLEVLEQEWRY